jgi:succinyl-CoA synthetase beta subunit
MKLHEYQSKEIFRKYGIPTPEGIICNTPKEASKAVLQFKTAAIKAQVLVGGRGKAGGIAIATPENAIETALRIMGLTTKCLPVGKVLVEQNVDIRQEFYLSITLDRRSGRPILIASASGGVDIEEVARTSPDLIHKELIEAKTGPQPDQLEHTATGLGISDVTFFSGLVSSLYAIYDELDCTLAEINPLVLTGDGRLVALDAKINIDDNALFRQPAMQQLYEKNLEDLDPLEVQVKKLVMSYVAMDGDIGCIVNGAGLALATLDMISIEGGTSEQEAAEYIKEHVTKPVVDYVVGISAPPGKTMGHAGAIISGGGGTAREKIEVLEGAGVMVAGSPGDVAGKINRLI